MFCKLYQKECFGEICSADNHINKEECRYSTSSFAGTSLNQKTIKTRCIICGWEINQIPGRPQLCPACGTKDAE